MKFLKILFFLIVQFYSIRVYCSEETVRFGRFGAVTLYHQTAAPSHVVLFVSGDGGWNLGVVDMARELQTLDALVVGIDIRHYLRQLEASQDRCSYPAADFESLSKFVQKSLNYSKYVPPVLIGYSSGATLVYAALVQAPPTTFAGAMSMGFCPDLPLTRPMCKGRGLTWVPGPKGKGYSFSPSDDLEAPWVALQGAIDQVCRPALTEEFAGKVRGAEVVMLPKVGHGFSAPRNWMPQFRSAFHRLIEKQEAAIKTQQAPSDSEIKDLPLVEVPAQGDQSLSFAVIVSGDGGWASIDRDLGITLSAAGVSVVGFNSLEYFWNPRTPDQTAKDLERVLRHYLNAWKKESVLLIGFSFGADVLPFLADRLPADLSSKVKVVALLSPGRTAAFEFHLTDWLNVSHTNEQPTLPEVEKLKGTRILCFYGNEEEDSLCTAIDSKLATIIPLAGGHHFGGHFHTITDRILAAGK